MLLVIRRTSGSSVIPGQLYNDLVDTSRDVYISAMLYKEKCPDQPLYPTQVGTDVVESFSKVSRDTHNSNTMDCLEMINRSQWLHVIEDIFHRHPEWAAKHYGAKRLNTTVKLDHSNTKEWDANKLKLADVDIVSCCVRGRHKAALLLLDYKLFTPDEIKHRQFSK